MRDALNSFKHDPQTSGTGGHKGHEGKTFLFKFLSPENVWAFLLFLIVAALIVFTTDDSPVWIYQGF